MLLETVKYQSDIYQKIVDLRNEVLRKPIGLEITSTDIRNEANDTFIACLENQDVIGCCILTTISPSTAKLRQMAVKTNSQKKGIGENILMYAEDTAKANGFSSIELHARKVALGFYLKFGYEICSEEFTEVGIPHFAMQKKIK